jgi:hypothetical protein
MPRRARLTNGDNPLRSTSRERAQTVASDKVRSVGVTLRESEIRRLGQLADGLGVSRNELMRYLLRRGIRDIDAGTLEPETRTETRLALP